MSPLTTHHSPLTTHYSSSDRYDVGEGLFIFIFFTYLCYYVKLALTDDFYAEDATDVRCLKITPELIYCLQVRSSRVARVLSVRCRRAPSDRGTHPPTIECARLPRTAPRHLSPYRRTAAPPHRRTTAPPHQLYFSSNFADLPFFIGDAMAGRRPVKDTIIMIFHHALSSVW